MTVKAMLWGFTGLGIVALLLDLFVHRHVIDPWERLFGFYALFGFIGVTALVYGAKLLRRIVMRDEDYYDVD